MFGMELRYDCNDYLLVSTTAQGFRPAILRQWPHGLAVGARRFLAIFRRNEKRRQLVRNRL